MSLDRRRWALLAAAVFCCVGAASVSHNKVIARIDLSKPFHLPPGASFTVTQGPDIIDPYNVDAAKEAGKIHVCVQTSQSANCAPDLDNALSTPADRDPFAGVHYLEISEIAYPRGSGAPPVVHVQLASVHATNGSQGHAAFIIGYRSSSHRFEKIFSQVIGGNRNQEIRYVASGPLSGAVISAEPTEDAPYGYWITVNELTPGYRYRQVLRYRSATHYGDGNPLAVIDSEMPNILRRLRVWWPGQALPLPKSGCAKPRLVKSELWCS